MSGTVEDQERTEGSSATTSLATSPAWCGETAAARPWTVAAAEAAVTGSSPLARNAATTPVSTSPVPAVASDGGPVSQTTGPPVGACTIVPAPFNTTTAS